MAERITIIKTYDGRQPKPYAGDLWEGTIAYEVEHGGEWWPIDNMPRDVVEQLVQKLTGFKTRQEEPNWFTPRLIHLNNERQMHVWHYKVERPYDD